MAYKFRIDDEQVKKFQKWAKEHEEICEPLQTAIGGRFTFKFTPTSIADVVKVECACGAEIDLSDYDNW